MFELPKSAAPWRFTPYGNIIIFQSADHPPYIFADGALKILELGSSQPQPRSQEKPPLYPSSVVGTDFDFITDDDPTAFKSIAFVGLQDFEMPDKRPNRGPLIKKAYVFRVRFSDGTEMLIAEDRAFGSRAAALKDAKRYTSRLGKLPKIYREKIVHIVVHKGGPDTTGFAEDKGHFFVIYSDNATKRIGTHDLEETLFHEASHASIQVDHLSSAAWQKAVAADNAHITKYAKNSSQEDWSESALFAYTIIKHPERFPQTERAKIEAQIPNRIAFFRDIFG
jgi:hypothetical protein